MGNIPAKITGKYQSYDINTPSHLTPPIPVRHEDQLEQHLPEENRVPTRSAEQDFQSERLNELDFNQTNNSNTNSVYNEQAVDTGENGSLFLEKKNKFLINF